MKKTSVSCISNIVPNPEQRYIPESDKKNDLPYSTVN